MSKSTASHLMRRKPSLLTSSPVLYQIQTIQKPKIDSFYLEQAFIRGYWLSATV